MYSLECLLYFSDGVDLPDFVPKWSNVERGQRLDGWPDDTLQYLFPMEETFWQYLELEVIRHGQDNLVI